MLQKEGDKEAMLEQMVEKLKQELSKVKHSSDLKDLKVQEASF